MKEKVNYLKVKSIDFLQRNYALLFLVLFYSLFHIFLSPSYWDDKQYRNALGHSIENLIPFLIHGYKLQTSRTAIEFVIGILSLLPHVVWKVLDILVIVLLYKELKWFIDRVFKIGGKETAWILALLLCAYPFSTMASAGWLATTTNYLWVIAFGMYASNKIWKSIVLEEKLSVKEYILVVMALIYSACFETMAILMFGGCVIGILYQKFRKRVKISPVMWISLLIIILCIGSIVVCPGNRNRLQYDVGYWMEEFEQLNFVDKIRIGIVHAFMHFVSIPSPIFFILNVECFILTCIKVRHFGKRIVAVLPLMINIGWTGYYLINYFVGNKAMTYQVPEPLLKGGPDTIEQIGLCISVLIWFASLFYSMWTAFEKKVNFYLCIIILVIGCIPEIVVGLTPTVVTSMLRTTIYLYMAMILIIVCFWGEIQTAWKSFVCLRLLGYITAAGGILLNAIQIIRHILIYG